MGTTKIKTLPYKVLLALSDISGENINHRASSILGIENLKGDVGKIFFFLLF